MNNDLINNGEIMIARRREYATKCTSLVVLY